MNIEFETPLNVHEADSQPESESLHLHLSETQSQKMDGMDTPTEQEETEDSGFTDTVPMDDSACDSQPGDTADSNNTVAMEATEASVPRTASLTVSADSEDEDDEDENLVMAEDVADVDSNNNSSSIIGDKVVGGSDSDSDDVYDEVEKEVAPTPKAMPTPSLSSSSEGLKNKLSKYGNNKMFKAVNSDEEFLASSGSEYDEVEAAYGSKKKKKHSKHMGKSASQKPAKVLTEKELEAQKQRAEKAMAKKAADLRVKEARMQREQTDLTLMAKMPTKRAPIHQLASGESGRATPSFMAWAKPAAPSGYGVSSAENGSSTGKLKFGKRAAFLSRLPQQVLNQAPKLLGGARFINRGKHGQFNANSLLQSTESTVLLLDANMSTRAQEKQYLKIDKAAVQVYKARTFGKVLPRDRQLALKQIKKQINQIRASKVHEERMEENLNEERGFEGENPNEMEEDAEEDAEEGDDDDDFDPDAEGEDGEDGDDGEEDGDTAEVMDAQEAELNAEVTRVSTPLVAGYADARATERSGTVTPVQAAPAAAPSDGNFNPAAFFGASLQITATAQPVALPPKRRLSSNGSEPPGTPMMDGRPATPILGTPNHRIHAATPEMFGSGTPQSFSPFLSSSVSRPRPERSNSSSSSTQLAGRYGKVASSFGQGEGTPNSAMNARDAFPAEDSQDLHYGGQQRPRSLSADGAFTPVNNDSSESSQFLDENGFMMSRSTSGSGRGGGASQLSQSMDGDSFDSGTQGASQEVDDDLLALCSGVFEDGEEVSASQEEAGNDDDEDTQPQVDEDEDETAGFFVEEAEVSGESEDEEETASQNVSGLVNDESEEEFSDGDVFYDLGDDDDDHELAAMKARFLRNNAHGDDEDEEDRLRKKAMNQRKLEEATQKLERKRKEEKAARKLRKKEKKARKRAEKAAAAAAFLERKDGSDDDMFGSDTEDQSAAPEVEIDYGDDEEGSELAEAQRKIDLQIAKMQMIEQHCRPEDELSRMADGKAWLTNRIINTNTSNSLSNTDHFRVRRASSSGSNSTDSASTSTSPISETTADSSTCVSTSLWKKAGATVLAANKFKAAAGGLLSPSQRPLRRRSSWMDKDDSQKEVLRNFTKPSGKKGDSGSKKGGSKKGFTFQTVSEEASNQGKKKRAFGNVGQNDSNKTGGDSGYKKSKHDTTPPTTTSGRPVIPKSKNVFANGGSSMLFDALKRQNSA